MTKLTTTIEQVRRKGDDVVLWTRRKESSPVQKIRIKGATVEPMPGDTLNFTGVGEEGYIEMDGNHFPYVRTAGSELEQAW
jgi:hypothetical protein